MFGNKFINADNNSRILSILELISLLIDRYTAI